MDIEMDTNKDGVQQTAQYDPKPEDDSNPGSDDKNKPDTLYLIFTMFTATLVLFTGGIAFAWTSPVIPKLLSNDTNINSLSEPITTLQVSLLAALPNVFSIFGAFAGPRVADAIGRKRTLQIVALVMIMCDVVTAFSNEITIIIVSKSIYFSFYIAGLGIVIIYTTEVSEDHNRGKYGSLVNLFFPIGTLYSYLLGPIFSMKVFTLLTTIPIILFLIFFAFAPESPIYSLSKGRHDECEKTLRKLRSNKNLSELKTDLVQLEQSLEYEKNKSSSSMFSIFRVREGRIGLLLVSVPVLLQFGGAGAPILIGFMEPVFNQAGTNLSGETVAVIIGVVKVVSCGLATVLVDKIGRKPLMLFSSIVSFLCLFFVGIYFYLERINSPILPSILWLPIVSMIGFIIAYSLGINSVPSTLLGEMFTNDFRSSAVSFVMTMSGAFISFLFFAFPLVGDYLGLHWCMWYFSINCLLGAIFIYITLPETKCKSILEIQLLLKNYKFSSKKTA